jgi:hypothetical protein
MPMKISLVLHPRRPLSRAEAWGCFTANLALPGSGSLIAGRWVGYFQILLALIGLGVSLVAMVQVFVWYIHNHARLNDATDPFAGLAELFHQLLKPVVGFAIFGVAILWAVVTSWSILRGTSKG